MWQEILSALIAAVGSALVGFLIFGIKKFTAWLSAKTSDVKLKAILNGASSVTEMVVEEVYQTYVESLKGKNAFNKAEQESSVQIAIINFAVKQNIIKFNPMYSVKLPMKRNEKIKSRSKPHVYIPPEKIDMIFERFTEGSSDYIPLLLGYRCGLRLGEAFGLTWDCIDFEKKTLTVNKQVQWDEKMQCWYFTAPKYDSFRTIEIDDELVAIFAHLRDKQLKAKTYYAELYTELYEGNKRAINAKEGTLIELVCIRENGTYIQPRTMQHTASIIHHKMNYPEFTFHSLRHTHATILAENDVPPKYVQERLGHKDIYTTLKFYQHLTKKISEKGTGIMSKIFATT